MSSVLGNHARAHQDFKNALQIFQSAGNSSLLSHYGNQSHPLYEHDIMEAIAMNMFAYSFTFSRFSSERERLLKKAHRSKSHFYFFNNLLFLIFF